MPQHIYTLLTALCILIHSLCNLKSGCIEYCSELDDKNSSMIKSFKKFYDYHLKLKFYF